MNNKLTKEQRIKLFTQRIIKFAREQIELGRNYGWSEDTIAKDLQFLIADEIASAKEEDRNSFIGFVFRCTQPDKGDLFDVIDDLMSEYTSSKEKND